MLGQITRRGHIDCSRKLENKRRYCNIINKTLYIPNGPQATKIHAIIVFFIYLFGKISSGIK